MSRRWMHLAGAWEDDSRKPLDLALFTSAPKTTFSLPGVDPEFQPVILRAACDEACLVAVLSATQHHGFQAAGRSVYPISSGQSRLVKLGA
jgi:hypothetical protein